MLEFLHNRIFKPKAQIYHCDHQEIPSISSFRIRNSKEERPMYIGEQVVLYAVGERRVVFHICESYNPPPQPDFDGKVADITVVGDRLNPATTQMYHWNPNATDINERLSRNPGIDQQHVNLFEYVKIDLALNRIITPICEIIGPDVQLKNNHLTITPVLTVYMDLLKRH